jgi:Ca-activated chloride channel family protein
MRTFLVRMAALCLLLMAGSVPARAEQGLFIKGREAEPVPVLGATVEVRITGVIARAKVTQVFKNPSRDWVEGIYVFPLPEEAAVDTLKMKVGERTVVGEIKEKAAAQQTYQAAKQEGRKASLIEQQRPDVFTASVANIGPGETVEIVIEMQQIVRWDAGRFRLRFPMVVAPRYSPPWTGTSPKRAYEGPLLNPPVLPAGSAPVNPFAFHVDLAAGFPLGWVKSPSHGITVQKGKNDRYAVDLARSVALADSDFILEWAPAVGKEPRAVFYSEEVDGERYDLLMVMPPDAPEAAGTRLPREAVFIIDTSGSMSGVSMEQARRALLLALDRLRPGDWFNVIQFNSEAEALFPDSVPVEPGALETARQYVRKLEADGGTNILAGVKLALEEKAPVVPLARSKSRDGLVRQITFVTDGQVDNEAEVFQFLNGHLGNRRLFTVAIGSAPNVSFLRKSADLGRGTFTHISSVPEVAGRMGALFAQLEAPMLRDLEVRWADPAAEVWPARIPDLYLGEPLTVVARRGSSSGPAEVSGWRGGEAWQDSFPAAAEIRGAGIHKLWAKKKIEALLDSLSFPAGAAAADPEEVRRAVVGLGLRHHLVTPYTSLVAVDEVSAAPAGVEPVRRIVPVNPPAGGSSISMDGEMMSESIMVTAESPMLDERRITTGCTVSQTEIEKIPTARDPWAVLQATPGVLTDSIDVGGNESGQAPTAVGLGASADQALWALDGVVITDTGTSSSPGSYDFDSFEEVQVTTGGADATLATPGVLVNRVTKRGTNMWRGSGELLWGGNDQARQPDGIGQGRKPYGLEGLRSANAEWGGPLSLDQLWIWGALHHAEIDRKLLGGQSQESLFEGGSFRLNAQLATSNSASLFWNREDAAVRGLGASPARAPETTWDRDGREELWKLEDTHIFASDFYVSGLVGGTDRMVRDVPLGGSTGDARVDPAGVAQGAWFGLAEGGRTKIGELAASYFFNAGPLSHELKAGLSWRGQDSHTRLTAPGLIEVAGEILENFPSHAVVEVWHGGTVRTETSASSAWLQDVANVNDATFTLGLRFDEQDLGIPGGSRPRTLSPRLGLNYSAGPERKTLLKASLSRFASRLGTDPAQRLSPDLPSVSYFIPTVEGELVPWYSVNRDPLLNRNPNAVDPDLKPEITDELALGVEHALRPEFVIGLQGTWRRTKDVLEERLLVRDETGRTFVATADDWVPADSILSASSAPVFDLRPGLTWTGGTLLTNGDRRQDYLGFSLFWDKRLANRWMTRGHVTWSDWTWCVGPGFARYDDPTRALGGGDRDGDPVAEPASALDRPYAADRFINGRWSFHWDGFYQFSWLDAGFAVNGREGYPAAGYRQVVRDRAGIARVPIAGLDSSRNDAVVTVDARLEKEISIGDAGLTFGLDVFNLLNDDTVLWRENDLGTSRAGLADDILAPRTYRLGVRVTWR